MIKCSQCTHLVHEETKRCDYCGMDPRRIFPRTPRPEPSFIQEYWSQILVFLLLLVFAVMLIGTLSHGGLRQCVITRTSPQKVGNHSFLVFQCQDAHDEVRQLMTREPLKSGDLITYDDYEDGPHRDQIKTIIADPDHPDDAARRIEASLIQPETDQR